MEGADFSGYATKAGLKCRDGRTITPEAFKHMDKMTVPLVWQHSHDTPDNVLGHMVLEARSDGVYAYGFFNNTPRGTSSKELVKHKDITALSIYANDLVEKSKTVLHGNIREVSLVLAGANKGARIDYVRVQHGDGEIETLEDEAVIHWGLSLDDESEQEVEDDATLEHSTVQEVWDTLSPEQKDLTHYMIARALEAKTGDTAAHAEGDPENPEGETNEGDLEHQEGTETDMGTHRNVFEQQAGTGTATEERHVLSHDAIQGIVASAKKSGSLKEAVDEYALAHGITNIGTLFPDAKSLTDRPEFNKRRTEWVAGVINGVRRTPFSRVKSLVADLTQDEARAKGYITGTYKKEEWFAVTSRTTTPTTIYKKQKLDRDDILDITDFDVVAWLRMEMRMMLEEEIARAILIGDGRDPGDADKIKDPGNAAEGAGIRAIANENELYAVTVNVNIGDANSSYTEIIESLLRSRRYYKGTGTPTLYTTEAVITEMLLTKDTTGRRYYQNTQELAAALRVQDIVAVEAMEDDATVIGIIVNLADYNLGADRGGEVNLFDDFDIDYNQYKYLIETRASGALVKIRSALVIRPTTSTNVLVTPTVPTFVESTGVVTIVATTGVVYKNDVTNATLSAGAQSALAAGATLKVRAEPASGYYFSDTVADGPWTFKRPAA
jgi:HK97 family phage prohead protease